MTDSIYGGAINVFLGEYAAKSNSPKMKEIAATLTEESNPVLVVATLK